MITGKEYLLKHQETGAFSFVKKLEKTDAKIKGVSLFRNISVEEITD